ncbi:hypothetical protein MRX96_026563 [Rhipicephalus microplus]
MDEYEREFGDLLYLRSKPTVYERFYNDNIKNMVTKYNFLPAELIECRMQSLWKKLLAKNPALRSRHESNIRDAKLLCAKNQASKDQDKGEYNTSAYTKKIQGKCPIMLQATTKMFPEIRILDIP